MQSQAMFIMFMRWWVEGMNRWRRNKLTKQVTPESINFFNTQLIQQRTALERGEHWLKQHTRNMENVGWAKERRSEQCSQSRPHGRKRLVA